MNDFRGAEPAIIETGKDQFGEFLRDILPRLQSYALESGDFVGKVDCEITVDLTPGRKSISLVGKSAPKPWEIKRKAEIRYKCPPPSITG